MKDLMLILKEDWKIFRKILILTIWSYLALC